ncbi:MAG: IS200/IS605 family transposase [Turicibacter sp.]|nr:IS200/IS605 family transposase [Turicibacter sp.]
MVSWKSKNRHKFLLQFHVIFVCKYRKKLLSSKIISDDIKQLSLDIAQRHNVTIKYMETDKDHIHYMIETDPTVRLSDFVRTIKSFTTFHIWKLHESVLKTHFWKERTFWTDGYFISSIGNVSEATLQSYIEQQG